MKIAAFLVACLALAAPVMAAPLEQDEIDHVKLLKLITLLKIPVRFDSQYCKDMPKSYGGYRLDGADLSLCSRGDLVERLNTVRHEAWHVYQDLKDCSIADDVDLVPVFSDSPMPRAYKENVAKLYETQYVNTEAEAFWAADTFDANSIGNLIYQRAIECSFKF